MAKLKSLIVSLLPGFFLIGYNIGTGSITAMSKAGANFGLTLLWTVLVSCMITYYLIVLFSRYTMVTGETAIEGFRRHIHPVFAVVMIGMFSIIIITALMGVLGIIADALAVWSATWVKGGIRSEFWAILIATVLYITLWFGNSGFFTRALAVLVSIMSGAFLITMCIKLPPLSEIAQGLIPQVPKEAAGSDNSPMVIIASMVGTTVSSFVFIIRTGLVLEAGWTMKDAATQRRDARISAALMFFISTAIMITAASTLGVEGLKMNRVSEMIPLMEPVAGHAAVTVFVVGIVAAGLSSHLPNLLVIPWLFLDFRGKPHDTQTMGNRLLLLGLSFVSIIGAVFHLKPIFIMLISQAALTMLLPLTLIAIVYITSQKSIMGKYHNKSCDYGILILIMSFAIYMGVLGIQGLIVDINANL